MLHFSPKYLGAVLRTGSSKSLKWLLCDGFALQFVISLKNTRTGKDCTSNALENTSIKNWLIQWNRAKPGETGRQTVSHRRTLTCCLQGERWGSEKKGFLIQLVSKTPECFNLLKDGFSEQMIRTAQYDLELPNLFLACFHPLSVENNDTAWISIFINGFLFKIDILLEVFPLHFRQTSNFLNPSGMCKPGCKALLKCMLITYSFILFLRQHRKRHPLSHFPIGFNFFK